MERIYSKSTLRKRRVTEIVILVILLILLLLLGVGISDLIEESDSEEAWKESEGELQDFWFAALNMGLPPILQFQEQEKKESVSVPALVKVFAPAIFSFTWQKDAEAGEVLEEQTMGTVLVSEPKTDIVPIPSETVQIFVSREEELSLLQENIFREENPFTQAPIASEMSISGEGMTKLEGRSPLKTYDLSLYRQNMTQLIKDFYIIDSSTSPDAGLLDIDKLTKLDCTLDKNTPGPQILIYHSHSQEGFADSVPGDVNTTIVGAGAKLASLLEEYGYQVLHHTGVYDVPSRDNAYSNALPGVEKVLADNPTIQVVIDLHRDAVAEGTKLVQEIDGKNYARFMFFNGICRSTKGPITYLDNPYLQDNMSFSFQSQVVAESYFPGITRKIYLKAWRYNMHFRPRNMLIELGAQTNTVEEVMNTTEILAFIIDKVLSGQ